MFFGISSILQSCKHDKTKDDYSNYEYLDDEYSYNEIIDEYFQTIDGIICGFTFVFYS